MLPLKSSARASAPRLEACSISSAYSYGYGLIMQTQFKGQSHVMFTSTAALLLLCGHDGRPAGVVSLQGGLKDFQSTC